MNPQTSGCSSCEGNNSSLVSLAPAYSFVQGSVHQITITASAGTAPYKYSITMDTTVKATDVAFAGTSVIVPYTFSESAGAHTLKITVKDACGGTGTVSNIDTSAITITTVTPVLTTVTVTNPNNCKDTIRVGGTTCQLAHTCVDQFDATITCSAPVWTTTAGTGSVTVSSTGLVTGVTAGTATVTATTGGKSGSLSVTVLACTPPVCGFTIV